MNIFNNNVFNRIREKKLPARQNKIIINSQTWCVCTVSQFKFIHDVLNYRTRTADINFLRVYILFHINIKFITLNQHFLNNKVQFI